MPQEIFEKVIHKLLPTAIPTQLEKIDEYSVGKVLIYSKKPRRLLPMRKHHLEFTGFSLGGMLASNEELTIRHASNYIFDTDKSTSASKINVNVGADVDLNNAVTKLFAADVAAKTKVKVAKSLDVTSDLGKLMHVTSDLTSTISKGSMNVNPRHAMVQQALENGGVMFVVAEIYHSERCNVTVHLSRDVEEGVDVNVTAEKVGVRASEDVETAMTSAEAVRRDQLTPVAFGLIKVEVNGKGSVTAKLNTGLSSKLHIHYDNAVATLPDMPETTSSTADSPDADSRETQMKQNRSQRPDHHYMYTLNDFQPLKSLMYQGILTEAKKWVAAFQANTPLHDAFFQYMKPPKIYQHLKGLSAYFHDVANAMHAGEDPPHNKLKDILPIMAALAPKEQTRLREITAIITIAEAAEEFPENLVLSIIGLSSDKKKLLLDIILETPLKSNNHTYKGEGPYQDPHLNPIMDAMGFSVPSGTPDLVFTRKESDDDEDSLIAALILLLASEQT